VVQLVTGGDAETMMPPTSSREESHRGTRRQTFVIVGAGQSGAQAAYTLREHGFQGRVVLVGDEAQVPYERPPLSKAFLARALDFDRLYLRPLSFYAACGVELKLHSRVESIDRVGARVRLHGGESLGYDKLLIATGSRPRTLDLPGSDSDDIHYLRTVQDAFRLRAKMEPGRRLVIIGGGFVGLEVAATAIASGAMVTLLEYEDRLLSRVTSDAISNFFSRVHRERGATVQCDIRVNAFKVGEQLEGVICEHGFIKADLAVVGIGAVPNDELARRSSLECDDGIVVDEYCRTSDPNVFAAGDCTNHWNIALGRRVRLESVQNAIDQAKAAALNMLGSHHHYAEVPWFWSVQYEHKLQSAGICQGYDEIEERGDRDSGRFALIYRKKGLLVGVDAVNRPRDYMSVRSDLGRKLASDDRRTSPPLEQTQQQAA
jgi:3-phenylpropionate/trans-cinnamate dioxygenase ferredoxin reductase subunit